MPIIIGTLALCTNSELSLLRALIFIYLPRPSCRPCSSSSTLLKYCHRSCLGAAAAAIRIIFRPRHEEERTKEGSLRLCVLAHKPTHSEKFSSCFPSRTLTVLLSPSFSFGAESLGEHHQQQRRNGRKRRPDESLSLWKGKGREGGGSFVSWEIVAKEVFFKINIKTKAVIIHRLESPSLHIPPPTQQCDFSSPLLYINNM